MGKEITIAVFIFYFFILTISVDFLDSSQVKLTNDPRGDVVNRPANIISQDQTADAASFVSAAKSFFTTGVRMIFFDIEFVGVSQTVTNIFLFIFVYLIGLALGMAAFIAIVHGG